MKVAIITLNYNGKYDTLELLESFKKLTIENGQLKIIMVDNASGDGSVSEIHAKFPNVDILQTGKNLGFGGGYNKGLEYAKIWGADYFFLINNDAKIADADILQKLINITKADPKIGIAAPKILFEKGFEFHKDRYEDKDLGKVIWYGGGFFDWNNIQSVHRGIDEVDKGQYNDVEETAFITGACFLIKREVLEKVGGFEGEYFLYFEDAHFNKKILDAGYKLYYCGNTHIYHKVSRSTGIGSKLTDYYHTRNRLLFGMQYASPKTKFALIREAFKLLFFGRPAQRLGVLDYYLGITGQGNVRSHIESGNTDVEYPLKLSIGIVNYNTADLTRKLLQSIFNKESGFAADSMEIIVLDNGMVDPCKEVIQEYLPKVKYLQNQENEGFSKGYNKTIKYSLGEYYLMLNSDIEVLKDALLELTKVEDKFKGEAVLGGKLIFPSGVIQDSVFHLPTITGTLKEYFLRQTGAYFMYVPEGEKIVQVDGTAMAAYLIPRKILDRVGLLDENIFILFEDVEYARRLKKYNVPIYFVPQVKFLHHHGASTKKQGIIKSYEQLKKSSMYYHGKIYYWLLYYTLLFCQKFSGTKTPGEIR